jgi:tRNA threonylcarbamoyladenosine biosynthesis protein TsaE
MQFNSHSLYQTEKAATYLLKKLKTEKTSQAVVIGLRGELGSGKTTFVRAVGKLLKVKNHITSPTFIIVRHYKLRDFSFTNLVHIDAYRLKSGKELESLGWDNALNDSNSLVFIEWPENVKRILPKDLVEIHFKFVDQSTRIIKIKWPEKKIKRKAQKKD